MINFKIVVPMYNVEKWVSACMKSIKNQEYSNFKCVVIDDISTDSTVEVVQGVIKDDPRFKLIVNKDKKYALQNIYEGINFLEPNEEDVIVTVDGDDWLYDSQVLNKVKSAYENSDCLLTYGNYIRYPDGSFSNLADYSKQTIDNNDYRSAPWLATHLRTFKHKLWKNIKKEDLLNKSGEFYRMGWDLAFMFPMLEMASGKHINIKEPLYVYNMANPINDNKVNVNLQLSVDREVRQKPKYQPLNF